MYPKAKVYCTFADICEDEIDYCDKQLDKCGKEEWTKTWCKRSCGYCTKEGPLNLLSYL